MHRLQGLCGRDNFFVDGKSGMLPKVVGKPEEKKKSNTNSLAFELLVIEFLTLLFGLLYDTGILNTTTGNVLLFAVILGGFFACGPSLMARNFKATHGRHELVQIYLLLLV